jgi:putative membrane protein
MSMIAKILMAVLAGLHAYFGWLEMFRWTSPRTIEAFGMTAAFAESARVLAANQGLYNFLFAAGMAWSVVAPPVLARPLALFFAGAALIAGLYGGLTGPPTILLYQSAPAALALFAILASARAKLR